MTSEIADVNRTAPLRNVANFNALVKRVVGRTPGLPGMACFYGRSGLGKTKSAIYGANSSRAIYVEVGQFTTAKSLLRSILVELGVSNPRGSIADHIEAAIMRMSADIRRPLIVDEAHHIAAKHFVDVLRELHDKSLAPVILIGEETLPATLEKFERVHNRMLEWLGAEECNADDARTLVRAYCPSLTVSEELLAIIVQRTGGNTRRIVVAISRVAEAARVGGLQSIGTDSYDIAQITSHRAPAPRAGRAQ